MTRDGDPLFTATPTGNTDPLDMPSAPVLRIIEPGKSPRDLRLARGELTLGRSGDVHVVLEDKSVSRRHLVLRVEHDLIIARDLGSSRGTFVNGVRITVPTPIRPGDVLELGNQRLELRAADEPVIVRATAGVYARLSAAMSEQVDALRPLPRRSHRGSGPMITKIVGPGRLRAAMLQPPAAWPLPRHRQLALGVEQDVPPPTADAPDDDDPNAPALETFRVDGGIRPRRRPRRRFVRQHDEMDCGAACLAMISMAYGRNINLSTYRSRIELTREGASMWSLIRAAREAGFESAGVQCRLRAVQDLQLPAIALTQRHYVVLYEVTKTTVLVGDPAVGLRRLRADEFKAVFSETLLLLRPTDRFFEKPESPPAWLDQLAALAPGHARPALEIMMASLLVFVLGLILPLLSQTALDRLFVHRNRDQLTTLALALVAVASFSIVLGIARGCVIGVVANRFNTLFAALAYRHVMRLRLSFFMVRRVCDMSTSFRELLHIRRFFTSDALTAVIEVSSIALYVVALFIYSTGLGSLALLLTPLVAATSIACSRKLSVLAAALAAGVEQLTLTAMLYAASRMAIDGELTIGNVVAVGMFSTSIFGTVHRLATQWTDLRASAARQGG